MAVAQETVLRDPAAPPGAPSQRGGDDWTKSVADAIESVVSKLRDRTTVPLTTLARALVFGLIAALVASYKALTAKGGPKGVGDAVNQSVVITFMLLFLTNFIITAIYFQVVPQKGG